MKEVDINEWLKRRKPDDILVDVRESFLFKTGNISGAVNIPMSECDKLCTLPRGDVYVYCQRGDVSGEAVELLEDFGYNACNLRGGYLAYLRGEYKE